VEENTLSALQPDPSTAEALPTVLTVNRVGFLGGVERIIIGCADAARASGFRPVIACPAPGALASTAEQHGHHVVSTLINRGKSTMSPVQLLRLALSLHTGRQKVIQIARAERASVLHTHHPVSALFAISAASRLNLPLIWHAHETLPVRPQYSLLGRRLISRCAFYAACSGASRDMLLYLGAPPDRVHLIYNAVDPAFMETPAPADDVRALPGPHVGLFGVLEPRKGQEAFLRAAALLVRHPAAQFWIVGPLSYLNNAAYVKRLRALAAESGLAERVHFTGFREDIPRLMAGMDVVVLASTGFESLPMVLLEACALGRRIVAADVGGVREIIRHGKTGFVVDHADPALLAGAIERILDPEGAGLAAAARADVVMRFSQTRFARDITALYDQALGRLPRATLADVSSSAGWESVA